MKKLRHSGGQSGESRSSGARTTVQWLPRAVQEQQGVLSSLRGLLLLQLLEALRQQTRGILVLQVLPKAWASQSLPSSPRPPLPTW